MRYTVLMIRRIAISETTSGPSYDKGLSSEDDSELATDGSQSPHFMPSIPACEQNAACGKGKPSKRGMFQCPLCPHISHYLSALNIHLRKHSGEKPFKCSFCSAAFAQAGTYNRHVRTHTGEKPFKCDVCPFSSAHSQALIYHRTTHARCKPFTCEICFSACVNKGMLLKHMRTHMEKKTEEGDATQPRSSSLND